MADDDQTERDTVPLPDAENPAPEVPPAHGHLIDASATGDAGAARPIASPFQIAPPGAAADADDADDADVDSIAVTSSRTAGGAVPDDEVDLDVPDRRGPVPADPRARTVRLSPVGASGRSKGLIAAAVAGVLVVGGAVAATVGGGSGKGQDKSAAPTAGLIGQQVSSGDDNGGGYASSAASGSPWVWQTGQSTAKYPGATTGSPSAPGAPKPTGSSSVPGTPQSSGPGMPQRSSSAPGVPSAPVPPPASSSAGGPVTPPSGPPPATVTLVTGPGCPSLPGGGYDAVGSGSGSGWGSNSSGGWGGCKGSMQSMPLSGDANNAGNRALWSFGSGTAGFASCAVSVYVPWDGKATDTGGTAAEYQVSEGAADTYVTSFTVNQNTTHGQWVPLGTVNVGGNTVKLRLLDHGVDFPTAWRYGISAAELQCTA
ncbi:hypothetical protein ABH920_002717 [Catenulispora sp. EB89]|uniref:hypothetical protein n=1 Tax=Catenulispora sp. EB89 TaxID=3156257 RepID=UPI0035155D3A